MIKAYQESVKTQVKKAEKNVLMGDSDDEQDYGDHLAKMVDGAEVCLNLELSPLCYSHCGVEVNLVLKVVLSEEQVAMVSVILLTVDVDVDVDVDWVTAGVGTGKESPRL